jgi:hypothetical protein
MTSLLSGTYGKWGLMYELTFGWRPFHDDDEIQHLDTLAAINIRRDFC